MNKKGFTLVELLGVMVIFVILALVSLPILINKVKKSENTLDAATKTIIYTATKLYVTDNFNYSVGDIYCVSLQTLKEKGYLFDIENKLLKESYDMSKTVKFEIINNANNNYNIVAESECVEVIN